jgi:hypothetical protein
MGMQRLIAAVLATSIGLTTVAAAQPGPSTAPAGAPAPAPAQTITGWWRFTLVDGQTLDAYVVSSDDTNLVIQTPQGTFTLERSRIAASSVLPGPSTAQPAQPVQRPYVPPANTYTPPQPYTAQSQAYDEAREDNRVRNALAGFAVFYGLAALIALARLDDDEDARYGFIPVAGPMIWAATDDDDFFEDGWDWLATLSTLSQLSIVGAFMKGDDRGTQAPKTGMTMTVMSAPGGGGGLSVMGSF